MEDKAKTTIIGGMETPRFRPALRLIAGIVVFCFAWLEVCPPGYAQIGQNTPAVKPVQENRPYIKQSDTPQSDYTPVRQRFEMLQRQQIRNIEQARRNMELDKNFEENFYKYMGALFNTLNYAQYQAYKTADTFQKMRQYSINETVKNLSNVFPLHYFIKNGEYTEYVNGLPYMSKRKTPNEQGMLAWEVTHYFHNADRLLVRRSSDYFEKEGGALLYRITSEITPEIGSKWYARNSGKNKTEAYNLIKLVHQVLEDFREGYTVTTDTVFTNDLSAHHAKSWIETIVDSRFPDNTVTARCIDAKYDGENNLISVTKDYSETGIDADSGQVVVQKQWTEYWYGMEYIEDGQLLSKYSIKTEMTDENGEIITTYTTRTNQWDIDNSRLTGYSETFTDQFGVVSQINRSGITYSDEGMASFTETTRRYREDDNGDLILNTTKTVTRKSSVYKNGKLVGYTEEVIDENGVKVEYQYVSMTYDRGKLAGQTVIEKIDATLPDGTYRKSTKETVYTAKYDHWGRMTEEKNVVHTIAGRPEEGPLLDIIETEKIVYTEFYLTGRPKAYTLTKFDNSAPDKITTEKFADVKYKNGQILSYTVTRNSTDAPDLTQTIDVSYTYDKYGRATDIQEIDHSASGGLNIAIDEAFLKSLVERKNGFISDITVSKDPVTGQETFKLKVKDIKDKNGRAAAAKGKEIVIELGKEGAEFMAKIYSTYYAAIRTKEGIKYYKDEKDFPKETAGELGTVEYLGGAMGFMEAISDGFGAVVVNKNGANNMIADKAYLEGLLDGTYGRIKGAALETVKGKTLYRITVVGLKDKNGKAISAEEEQVELVLGANGIAFMQEVRDQYYAVVHAQDGDHFFKTREELDDTKSAYVTDPQTGRRAKVKKVNGANGIYAKGEFLDYLGKAANGSNYVQQLLEGAGKDASRARAEQDKLAEVLNAQVSGDGFGRVTNQGNRIDVTTTTITHINAWDDHFRMIDFTKTITSTAAPGKNTVERHTYAYNAMGEVSRDSVAVNVTGQGQAVAQAPALQVPQASAQQVHRSAGEAIAITAGQGDHRSAGEAVAIVAEPQAHHSPGEINPAQININYTETSVTNYRRDSAGRVANWTVAINDRYGNTQSQTFAAQFDSFGRPTNVSEDITRTEKNPDGTTTTFKGTRQFTNTYDQGLGFLIGQDTVMKWEGRDYTETFKKTFTYNRLGQVKTENTLYKKQGRDENGDSIDQTITESTLYAYDTLGRKIAETITRTDSAKPGVKETATNTYTYDQSLGLVNTINTTIQRTGAITETIVSSQTVLGRNQLEQATSTLDMEWTSTAPGAVKKVYKYGIEYVGAFESKYNEVIEQTGQAKIIRNVFNITYSSNGSGKVAGYQYNEVTSAAPGLVKSGKVANLYNALDQVIKTSNDYKVKGNDYIEEKLEEEAMRYDTQGRLASQTIRKTDKLKGTWEEQEITNNSYNDAGLVASQTVILKKSGLATTETFSKTFTYRKDGVLEGEDTVYTLTGRDADGNTLNQTINEKAAYKYDRLGRRTEETIVRTDSAKPGVTETITNRYAYDDKTGLVAVSETTVHSVGEGLDETVTTKQEVLARNQFGLATSVRTTEVSSAAPGLTKVTTKSNIQYINEQEASYDELAEEKGEGHYKTINRHVFDIRYGGPHKDQIVSYNYTEVESTAAQVTKTGVVIMAYNVFNQLIAKTDEYNASGKDAEGNDYKDHKKTSTAYTYDSSGRVFSWTSEVTDNFGDVKKETNYAVETRTDELGLLIEGTTTVATQTGILQEKQTNGYNALGQLINTVKVIEEFDAQGNLKKRWVEKQAIEYDELGRVKGQLTEEVKDGKLTRTQEAMDNYNDLGFITDLTRVTTQDDGLVKQEKLKYKYDDMGRVDWTRCDWVSADDKGYIEEAYQYDPALGMIIGKDVKEEHPEDPDIKGIAHQEYHASYKYNTYGQVVEETQQGWSESQYGKLNYTSVRTYNYVGGYLISTHLARSDTGDGYSISTVVDYTYTYENGRLIEVRIAKTQDAKTLAEEAPAAVKGQSQKPQVTEEDLQEERELAELDDETPTVMGEAVTSQDRPEKVKPEKEKPEKTRAKEGPSLLVEDRVVRFTYDANGNTIGIDETIIYELTTPEPDRPKKNQAPSHSNIQTTNSVFYEIDHTSGLVSKITKTELKEDLLNRDFLKRETITEILERTPDGIMQKIRESTRREGMDYDVLLRTKKKKAKWETIDRPIKTGWVVEVRDIKSRDDFGRILHELVTVTEEDKAEGHGKYSEIEKHYRYDEEGRLAWEQDVEKTTSQGKDIVKTRTITDIEYEYYSGLGWLRVAWEEDAQTQVTGMTEEEFQEATRQEYDEKIAQSQLIQEELKALRLALAGKDLTDAEKEQIIQRFNELLAAAKELMSSFESIIGDIEPIASGADLKTATKTVTQALKRANKGIRRLRKEGKKEVIEGYHSHKIDNRKETQYYGISHVWAGMQVSYSGKETTYKYKEHGKDGTEPEPGKKNSKYKTKGMLYNVLDQLVFSKGSGASSYYYYKTDGQIDYVYAKVKGGYAITAYYYNRFNELRGIESYSKTKQKGAKIESFEYKTIDQVGNEITVEKWTKIDQPSGGFFGSMFVQFLVKFVISIFTMALNAIMPGIGFIIGALLNAAASGGLSAMQGGNFFQSFVMSFAMSMVMYGMSMAMNFDFTGGAFTAGQMGNKLQELAANPELMAKITEQVANDPALLQSITDAVVKDPQLMEAFTQQMMKDPALMNKLVDQILQSPENLNKVMSSILQNPEQASKLIAQIENPALKAVAEAMIKDPAAANAFIQSQSQLIKDFVAKNPALISDIMKNNPELAATILKSQSELIKTTIANNPQLVANVVKDNPDAIASVMNNVPKDKLMPVINQFAAKIISDAVKAGLGFGLGVSLPAAIAIRFIADLAATYVRQLISVYMQNRNMSVLWSSFISGLGGGLIGGILNSVGTGIAQGLSAASNGMAKLGSAIGSSTIGKMGKAVLTNITEFFNKGLMSVVINSAFFAFIEDMAARISKNMDTAGRMLVEGISNILGALAGYATHHITNGISAMLNAEKIKDGLWMHNGSFFSSRWDAAKGNAMTSQEMLADSKLVNDILNKTQEFLKKNVSQAQTIEIKRAIEERIRQIDELKKQIDQFASALNKPQFYVTIKDGQLESVRIVSESAQRKNALEDFFKALGKGKIDPKQNDAAIKQLSDMLKGGMEGVNKFLGSNGKVEAVFHLSDRSKNYVILHAGPQELADKEKELVADIGFQGLKIDAAGKVSLVVAPADMSALAKKINSKDMYFDGKAKDLVEKIQKIVKDPKDIRRVTSEITTHAVATKNAAAPVKVASIASLTGTAEVAKLADDGISSRIKKGAQAFAETEVRFEADHFGNVFWWGAVTNMPIVAEITADGAIIGASYIREKTETFKGGTFVYDTKGKDIRAVRFDKEKDITYWAAKDPQGEVIKDEKYYAENGRCFSKVIRTKEGQEVATVYYTQQGKEEIIRFGNVGYKPMIGKNGIVTDIKKNGNGPNVSLASKVLERNYLVYDANGQIHEILGPNMELLARVSEVKQKDLQRMIQENRIDRYYFDMFRLNSQIRGVFTPSGNVISISGVGAYRDPKTPTGSSYIREQAISIDTTTRVVTTYRSNGMPDRDFDFNNAQAQGISRASATVNTGAPVPTAKIPNVAVTRYPSTLNMPEIFTLQNRFNVRAIGPSNNIGGVNWNSYTPMKPTNGVYNPNQPKPGVNYKPLGTK